MLRSLTALLLVGSLLLAGCEQKESVGWANSDEEYCAQAEAILDKADAGPLVPLEWGRLVTAGARLVYTGKECGDRLDVPKETLCADLAAAYKGFRDSPRVPAGGSRDRALNQNKRLFDDQGCSPALLADTDTDTDTEVE